MSDKFPPGRGSQLTPDERRQIQRLKLIDGVSVSEIARQTGRDRETVANVLRADDSQTLRTQLEGEAKEAAMRILRVTVMPAATAWGTAIGVAAEKGDHRPARDLLLHTGVIQPIDGPQMAIGVRVIVGSVGNPAGPDPFEGLTQDASGNLITDGTKPRAGK